MSNSQPEKEVPINWDKIPETIEPSTIFNYRTTNSVHRKLKRHTPGNWWPEEMRIAAVAAYAATGSVKKASDISKVTYETVRRWKKEDWWAEMLARVRQEKDQELDAKFTRTVDKVLDLIDERITKGETIYDTKRGTLVSVPMSSRDAVKVGALAIEKRQLIRGEPTSRTEHIKSGEVKDKLTALAEEFKKFVTSKTIEAVKEEPPVKTTYAKDITSQVVVKEDDA